MAMNLHAVASNVISVVNPMETLQYQRSLGSTTGADGVRVPTYAAPIALVAQVQETTQDDLRKANALLVQGEKVKAWFTGDASGVVRMSQRGGDLFTRADGSLWLVQSVIETWPEWCSVLLVRQMPKAGA